MHLSSNSLSLILWVYWEEIFVRSVSHSILIDEANWSTMDSLMNHIMISVWQSANALPTFAQAFYIPDLTFRNLSGFDEKLDPNLKLFFKFFVRLSIFSLDSTFFLPQPLTVFLSLVYIIGLCYIVLVFSSLRLFLFLVYGQKKKPLAREMMMLEMSGRRRQRGQGGSWKKQMHFNDLELFPSDLTEKFQSYSRLLNAVAQTVEIAKLKDSKEGPDS